MLYHIVAKISAFVFEYGLLQMFFDGFDPFVEIIQECCEDRERFIVSYFYVIVVRILGSAIEVAVDMGNSIVAFLAYSREIGA